MHNLSSTLKPKFRTVTGVGMIGMGVISSKMNMVFGFKSFSLATAVLTTLYLFCVPDYQRRRDFLLEESSSRSNNKYDDSEHSISLKSEIPIENKSTLRQDIIYLCKNKTFVFTIFAFAATSAVAEISMVWYQEFLRRFMIFKDKHSACKEDFYFLDPTVNTTIGGLNICNVNDLSFMNQTKQSINCDNCSSEMISTYFGLISISCGIAGVVFGNLIAQKLTFIKVKNASPLVASGGQLLGGLTFILQGVHLNILLLFSRFWLANMFNWTHCIDFIFNSS